MATFVEFLDDDGEKISVNADQITRVAKADDESRTLILFGKDRGVTVAAHYSEVMEALRSA